MSKIQDYLSGIWNTTITAIALPQRGKYIEANPKFANLKEWVHTYLGSGSAHLFRKINAISRSTADYSAIRDENRNCIIPSHAVTIDNREYFLSIKGCGAYTDLFSEHMLSAEALLRACRSSDPKLIEAIKSIDVANGFIMSENWMNESPYGGHGQENALRELSVSMLANDSAGVSISGAYICPLIAAVRLPEEFESIARQFYWFRRFPLPFYQSIRLVPSNIRLYFESDHVISDEHTLNNIFGITNPEQAERFLLNFIKSGSAILSLFVRTARRNKKTKQIEGLCFHDVWFDKDCIVAPDGIIHFADLEGLLWKSVPEEKVKAEIQDEWHKLVFEFLNGLTHVFGFYLRLKGEANPWVEYRKELCDLVYIALQDDDYCYPKFDQGKLEVCLSNHEANIMPISIPFLE